MGHGTTNSILLNAQGEDEERALVRESVETIAKGTSAGGPRAGSARASPRRCSTLDLLAECGIEYVGNWVNDEQPYPMRVKSGTMLSMPYSIELNDIPNFLERKRTGEEFAQADLRPVRRALRGWRHDRPGHGDLRSTRS